MGARRPLASLLLPLLGPPWRIVVSAAARVPSYCLRLLVLSRVASRNPGFPTICIVESFPLSTSPRIGSKSQFSCHACPSLRTVLPLSLPLAIRSLTLPLHFRLSARSK